MHRRKPDCDIGNDLKKAQFWHPENFAQNVLKKKKSAQTIRVLQQTGILPD